MTKHRNWCGTLNNPKSNCKDWMDAKGREWKQLEFLVMQLELGESKTPHFQFYAEFKGSKTLAYVKKVFPGAHLEDRKGSRAQAIAYCVKEPREDGPWWYPKELKVEEYDNKPGKRTDIDKLYSAIKSGKRKRWLFENMTAPMFRHYRVYDRLRPLIKPPMRDAVEVILLYGDPGTGKSFHVYGDKGIDQQDVWTPPLGQGGWYDGYDGQSIVVLDDFMGASSHVTLSSLLRLLDRYSVQTPVKTAFTWFNPLKIYITSNYSPEKWYTFLPNRKPSYFAICRRINVVITCTKDEHGYHQSIVKEKEAWFGMLIEAKEDEMKEKAEAASLLCKLRKYNN